MRKPGLSAIHGLRDHDGPGPSYAGLAAEHEAYVAALEGVGVAVEVLPPLEYFPDSMFVEDPAFVFEGHAILLRPGTASRVEEADWIAPVLRENFASVHSLERGFCDGGDLLVMPDRVLIGLSSRTDREGAQAFIGQLAAIGLSGEIVAPPAGVLHLKTGCSLVDEETVLVSEAIAASGLFDRMRTIVVPSGDAPAANVLRVNSMLLANAQFPRTLDLLDRHGARLLPLDTREINRIDAGLSCMSLRWRRPRLQ
ncbi:dimethylarginine dimethylaminohydrolase family protein [Sphingomonas koreensis]|uniref:dimethylarginine dimethylaminohydrolase family protein n=1 Tax=Sphingomonas koreensis TaxID=93064 RepID=UPI0019D0517E|nr:arginine deiminase family protein [Sphingomonas koreensis]